MSSAGDSAVEIAAAVSTGRATAKGVVQDALARIAAGNPRLNAFTAILADRALRRAGELDASRARGRRAGRLEGVPFAVKNLFDVAGLTTRAGAALNATHAPARKDAFLIRQLEAEGAVLLGALNMGEYAYDFTGENAHDGPVRNPHDPARMSGGSSSGSAAAVAGGLVPISLASDTNGSIRVPSALCGNFGLKPTYGRLSRGGTFPFVSSLDHLGPMARSVADLALAYDVLQGDDTEDPAQTPRVMEKVGGVLGQGVAGLRIAIAGGYFHAGAARNCLEAVQEAAAALGASSVIELPDPALARSAAYMITASEGAALHIPRLRKDSAGFDPDTRDRFLAGALVPASFVQQAQKLRRRFAAQMVDVFARWDVLLAPATPVSAPLIGQKEMQLGAATVPVRANLGIYTQPFSFVGLPVALAPICPPGAMPAGVQIIAAPWREDHALRVAASLEALGVARPMRPPQEP